MPSAGEYLAGGHLARVDALRAFGRFPTQRIGMLNPDLGSAVALTEARAAAAPADVTAPPASAC